MNGLTNCKDCDKEISKEARKCVHCGANTKFNERITLISIVITGIVFYLLIFRNGALDLLGWIFS